MKGEAMTVIQKTVRVPEDHRITLELPGDIPAGDRADITVTVSSASRAASILSLAGALADSTTFSGDSAALIREIRDAW